MLDRPITDEKINGNYNNFYEFGSSQERRQAGAGAEDPAVDHQDRRHGREAVRDRHRRSGAQVSDRGAALSPPLRRGLEHGGAVVGLPDGEAGRAGEAAVVGEVRADGNLPRQVDRARPEAVLVPVALCRGPHHRGGDQRARPSSPPAPTASRSPSSTARRSASRCRGSTASSTSSRSCASRSPTSGRRAIGRTCRRPNTASGPTSIRRSPHPRWSQASEELIGTGERRPTLLFNGYGEYVADLYKGLEKRAAVGVTLRRRRFRSRGRRRLLIAHKRRSRALAGPAQYVGAGRPTITFQRGTAAGTGCLIWGDATTQRRQHDE